MEATILHTIPVTIALAMARTIGGIKLNILLSPRYHYSTIIHANSTICKKVTRGKHIKRHTYKTFKWTCASALTRRTRNYKSYINLTKYVPAQIHIYTTMDIQGPTQAC